MLDHPHPQFRANVQLQHHRRQRSRTAYICRERERRASLEAILILIPSGLSVGRKASYLSYMLR